MIETLVFSALLLVISFLAVRYLASQLGVISEDQQDHSPMSFEQSGKQRCASPRIRIEKGLPVPDDSPPQLDNEAVSSTPEPHADLRQQSFAFPEYGSDWQPPRPRKTRNTLGVIVSTAALGTLLYSWIHFGSFDAMFQKAFPGRAGTPQPSLIIPQGQDWAEVDGIRWFHLLGTDSSGIGFHGWVPELAFKENPPEPTPGGKTLMEKIGLPSVAEQVKAAKQLKKMSQELRRQNDRNTGK